jgi:hypothetical protein
VNSRRKRRLEQVEGCMAASATSEESRRARVEAVIEAFDAEPWEDEGGEPLSPEESRRRSPLSKSA